jgi:hypothetical protein
VEKLRLNFNIQVLSISVETKPSAKGSYQLLEVAYKDLSNGGKVTSKKIISFSSKEVFGVLSTSKSGDTFEITAEKNANTGYWDWTKATKSFQTGHNESPMKPAANYSNGGTQPSKGNWETPEERAKKQVYIIRQSSLANAVAALNVKTSPKAEEVIELAKQFEAYVLGTTATANVTTGNTEGLDDSLDDIPF